MKDIIKFLIKILLIILLVALVLSALKSCMPENDPWRVFDLGDGLLSDIFTFMGDLLPGGIIGIVDHNKPGDIEDPDVIDPDLDGDNSTGGDGDSSDMDELHSCSSGYVFVEGYNATCVSTGIRSHYKCSGCGKFFDLNKEKQLSSTDLLISINPNGHIYEYFSNGDGTHTKKCTLDYSHTDIIEDCSFSDVLSFDANEHFNLCNCPETINNEAHYDNDGDEHCDACNMLLDNDNGDSGDNSGDSGSEVPGGDQSGGDSTDNPGEEDPSDPEVPVEPDEPDIPDCVHEWTEWTVTKEPTCSSFGAKERYCKLCYALERQSITPVEHYYGSDKVCDVCGYEICPHYVEEWFIMTEATCETDGLEYGHCIHCGEYIEKIKECSGHHFDTNRICEDCKFKEPSDRFGDGDENQTQIYTEYDEDTGESIAVTDVDMNYVYNGHSVDGNMCYIMPCAPQDGYSYFPVDIYINDDGRCKIIVRFSYPVAENSVFIRTYPGDIIQPTYLNGAYEAIFEFDLVSQSDKYQVTLVTAEYMDAKIQELIVKVYCEAD